MRLSVVFVAFVVVVPLGCSGSGGQSTALCAELFACCSSMATPDLVAACDARLPDTTDGAACSAQLSGLVAAGMCNDAGSARPDAGAGVTCMTATFSCGPGGMLTYCHSATASGACTGPFYEVAGQTFPCASCSDLSACGGAARAACMTADAGTD